MSELVKYNEYAVKDPRKYRVVKNTSYQHETLGIMLLEQGDVLEQCIDDPEWFSNGLALVHEYYLAKSKCFKRILRKGLVIQNINLNELPLKKKKEFLTLWHSLTKKNYAYLLEGNQPVFISIGGHRLPWRLKKKFKKLKEDIEK